MCYYLGRLVVEPRSFNFNMNKVETITSYGQDLPNYLINISNITT